MKPKTKLRGHAGDAPMSELTRLKKLWRDTLTEPQRDYWRALFISEMTDPDIRKTLQVKTGVNLTDKDQLGRFRKWDAQEQTRAAEAERMAEDEKFFVKEFGDSLSKEQIREMVLGASYRRSLVTGDFSEGRATARLDLALESAKFNASLETEKLKLSKEIEARHREEFRLELEKHQIETSVKLLDQALRAKADEINASSLSQAEKIKAMRQAAFADVDALQASGQLKLPKT